jgi:hypothetical protein
MTSMVRGVWRRTARAACMALALGVILAPPLLADAQPAANSFQQLNDTGIGIYHDAKDRFHAAADPVVIVGFEDVMIRHHGQTRRVGHIPPAYQILKASGHAPRSIWAALRPAVEGLDPDATWRGKLQELRPRIVAARAALPSAGLSPEATARDQRMLDASLGMIDVHLSLGLPDRARLEADMRSMAPLILADAAEAARLQLEAIDADLRPWWAGLSEPERQATYVVVLGPKTPREGNLAYTYFVNLLGRAQVGYRVIYAEGIYGEAGGEALLAQLLTDRRLSADFFVDERRMERDILADGAEDWILQHMGRLGSP